MRLTSTSVRDPLLAALLFAALATAFLAPALFGDKVPLPTDLSDALLAGKNPWAGEAAVQNAGLADPVCSFYPIFEHALAQRARGVRANWLPQILCGHPDYFVPGRTPLMVVVGKLSPPAAFLASLWLQLALAGLAAWALARELGAGRTASAIAGIAFAYSLSGLAFLELGHWAEGMLALPVLLVALRRIALPPADAASVRWRLVHALLVALTYAWILLSNTLVAILAGNVAAILGGGWAIASGRARAAKLLTMALAAAVALGFALFELGPQLELMRASERPVFGHTEAGAPAREWLPRLGVLAVSLVAPDLFGHPAERDERVVGYRARAYFGVLPLLLALGALATREGRALWVLVSLVFAAASGSPVHRALAALFPGLGAIDPYRALFLTMPLVPVLAALGLAEWRTWLAGTNGPADRESAGSLAAGGPRRRRVRAVAAVSLAAALASVLAVPALGPVARRMAAARHAADTPANQRAFPLADRLARAEAFVERTSRRIGIPLALAALALGLLASGPAAAPGRRRALGLALVALTAADLGSHGLKHTPFGDRRAVYPPSREADFIHKQPGTFRVLPLGTLFVPNTAIHYGLESITGYDSIRFGDYEKLALAIGGVRFGHAFVFPDYPRDPVAQRTLRLMGVRYVISRRPLAAHLTRAFSGDFHVHEDPGWKPRVRWYAAAVRAADADAALAKLLDPAFDPDAAAVVTLPGAPATDPALSAVFAARSGGPEPRAPDGSPAFKVTLAEPDRLVVATVCAAPGLLVISQRLLPGWRAWVSGEPAALVPAQHSFTGVAVPAGSHMVVLRYEPAFSITGPRLALALCALAILVVVGSLWYPGRR